jgi:hypothetical protein
MHPIFSLLPALLLPGAALAANSVNYECRVPSHHSAWNRIGLTVDFGRQEVRFNATSNYSITPSKYSIIDWSRTKHGVAVHVAWEGKSFFGGNGLDSSAGTLFFPRQGPFQQKDKAYPVMISLGFLGNYELSPGSKRAERLDPWNWECSQLN